MRNVLRVAPFVLVLALPSFASAAGPVPDKNLEAAIRAGLHLDDKTELNDEKLKNLFVLESPNKGIKDLTGLDKCPNLALLRLSQNEVSDLAPLKDLANLQSLDLAKNAIASVEPLANLKKLQYLDLSDNKIAKLEPLSGLTALMSLDLSGNQVADLAPLGPLNRLVSLHVARNQAANLAPLAGLARLSTVDLSENPIEDVSPLAKLNDLNILILRKDRIGDLRPLVDAATADAKGPKRFAPFLRLYLEGNPLSDNAKNELPGPQGGGRAGRVLSGRGSRPPGRPDSSCLRILGWPLSAACPGTGDVEHSGARCA